jgi:hypothetical protein
MNLGGSRELITSRSQHICGWRGQNGGSETSYRKTRLSDVGKI